MKTVCENSSSEELLTTIFQLQKESGEKDFAIAQLKAELAQLKRMIFGAKSERYAPSELPGQLSLEIEQDTQATAPAMAVKVGEHGRRKKEKEKKHPVRMPFPKDLPVETTVVMPQGDLSDYKEIGEEITEELELVEAKLFVKRTVRKKYARKDGEGVIIGDLPDRLIPKGLFGPRLLTQILIDKYVDHLPLYRQMQRFERAGMKLAYSTLADVPKQICPWLEPLYDLLTREVVKSSYLQADETPTPVLDKNKKQKTHTGYHWVYRSPEARLVLFDYRESRGREGPREILKTFKGFLQTDGYAVYEDFENKKDIALVGCMAHARRYFEQAMDNDRQHAEHALCEIQKLYAIERLIREQQKTPEEILSLRKEESLPVLGELKKWLDANLIQVLPKSPIGKAITYTLARWEKLLVYTLHPQLEIDNNLVENAIRPTVVGRKNYLFSGSHRGAQRSAMIYSFFGSCKINNINPQQWLADVLSRIADTKTSQLHTLLPNNWMPPVGE